MLSQVQRKFHLCICVYSSCRRQICPCSTEEWCAVFFVLWPLDNMKKKSDSYSELSEWKSSPLSLEWSLCKREVLLPTLCNCYFKTQLRPTQRGHWWFTHHEPNAKAFQQTDTSDSLVRIQSTPPAKLPLPSLWIWQMRRSRRCQSPASWRKTGGTAMRGRGGAGTQKALCTCGLPGVFELCTVWYKGGLFAFNQQPVVVPRHCNLCLFTFVKQQKYSMKPQAHRTLFQQFVWFPLWGENTSQGCSPCLLIGHTIGSSNTCD